jgi:hypothetical protein
MRRSLGRMPQAKRSSSGTNAVMDRERDIKDSAKTWQS